MHCLLLAYCLASVLDVVKADVLLAQLILGDL
jgi:hypothetical protein